MARLQILPSAQAQFPKSANKAVTVTAAWNPTNATTQHPQPGGMDGWTMVHKEATFEVIAQLQRRGFTWVSLECHGTAQTRKDVRISTLI